MKNRAIIIIGILTAILIAGFFYNKYRIAPKIKLESLDFTDLDGNAVNLDSFKNKKLLINFFATWCGPCVKEMPSLEKAKSILEKDEFKFLFVSDESVERLQSFQEQVGKQLVILHSKRPLREYKIFTLPTTYVLNSSKKIVFDKIGIADWADEDVIANLKAIAN